MARRDEILAHAAELLDLDAYPDYGPMGMQVLGSEDVTKVVAGVSASRELFERAAAAGAQLVVVHHGIFWRNESPVVDRRMKGRLEALFAADMTLAAYHLALDAHLEIGNAALLARELGIEVDGRFGEVGVGGRLREPASIETLAARVREAVSREPLVFAHGPERVLRVAILTGGGGRYLLDAARAGYDLFLTGEPEEPSRRDAREVGIHFVAAGHDATERLGIAALAERLAARFGLAWEFIDVPNPV
ncbi:MAG: Nif3-like dinuclear metal center hexameric protein [Actinomycetota bacterium]|nr:Nif3-like dinuclear metal center hexameric protein [Actinomycetota bacterium]